MQLQQPNSEKIEEFLFQLQDACLIKDSISAHHFELLYSTDFSAYENAAQFYEYLQKYYPKLVLSDNYAQRKYDIEQLERQSRREWEYSPIFELPAIPERPPGDRIATPKQRRYLRILGVRNEEIVTTISKKQASVFIDQVIQRRDAALLSTESHSKDLKNNGKGPSKFRIFVRRCIMAISIFIAAIGILFIAIMLWAIFTT